MKSRRLALVLLSLALALVGAACGSDGDTAGGTTETGTPTETTAADPCAKENLELVNAGKLTFSTSNPSFPPWFIGADGGPWDPTGEPTKRGFEAAVAYAVAEKLGFTDAEVEWAVVSFEQSIAPGPKNYDASLQQVEYSAKRAQAVDFTDSYLELNQSLVAPKKAGIANATTIAELKDAKLGAPVGTTSYDYIVENIQPSQEPAVFGTLTDAVQALKNEQVDGIVVDLPTAFFVTAAQAPNSKIVGQFPPVGEPGYLGLVLTKGSPLTDCLNQALAELREEGTLDSLQQEWLQASAPVLE
jgi:polar amino acid transport system substrate-binding protein